MNIPFWKMHGASNDFILVDDRAGQFPAADRDWLAGIAARRTGIGCEGIILIQPSDKADFRMRFYNPDGGEVEMCGNGARCVARLANDIGVAAQTMTIDTVAGILQAEAMGDSVRLGMTKPFDLLLEKDLTGDTPITYSSLNTGVPHVVVVVEDIDECDVMALGNMLRYHQEFAPAGTNVNFLKKTGPNSIRVRTYERGVEAETLACGTGMVAASLIAAKLGLVEAPVDVTPASGDVLTVDFKIVGDEFEDVTLLGPAVHVFEGTLKY
ncbi:MAG: diaminopimelate epimerase [Kiritimatiellae bacterium]|nr:diaminopimelate epimerase [Kiritimatiellia bacterium]